MNLVIIISKYNKGSMMEFLHIIKAILALMFVLGLLFSTVWGLKYIEQKSKKASFFKKIKQNSRLEILETNRIDARTSTILLRCDKTDYLILVGSNNNLLLGTVPHNFSSETKDTK